MQEEGGESVERLLLRRVRRMESEAVVGRRRVLEAEAAKGKMEGEGWLEFIYLWMYGYMYICMYIYQASIVMAMPHHP